MIDYQPMLDYIAELYQSGQDYHLAAGVLADEMEIHGDCEYALVWRAVYSARMRIYSVKKICDCCGPVKRWQDGEIRGFAWSGGDISFAGRDGYREEQPHA